MGLHEVPRRRPPGRRRALPVLVVQAVHRARQTVGDQPHHQRVCPEVRRFNQGVDLYIANPASHHMFLDGPLFCFLLYLPKVDIVGRHVGAEGACHREGCVHEEPGQGRQGGAGLHEVPIVLKQGSNLLSRRRCNLSEIRLVCILALVRNV